MHPPQTPSQPLPPTRRHDTQWSASQLLSADQREKTSMIPGGVGQDDNSYNSDDEHLAYSLANRREPPRYAAPRYMVYSSPMHYPDESRSPANFPPIPFHARPANVSTGFETAARSDTASRRSPVFASAASAPPAPSAANSAVFAPASFPVATNIRAPSEQEPQAGADVAPRQRQFTAAEDRILTDVLLSIVMEGAAPDNNFKKAHYQRVADAINSEFPGRQRDFKAVKNRDGYLKRTYFLPMKELKEMSGSGWDEEKMEVLLDNDVWESIRAAGQADRYALRGKSWSLYSDWETMYQGRTAHGEEVITPGNPTARRNLRSKRNRAADEEEQDHDDEVDDDDETETSGRKRGRVATAKDGDGDSSDEGMRSRRGGDKGKRRKRMNAEQRTEALLDHADLISSSIDQLTRVATGSGGVPTSQVIRNVYARIDKAADRINLTEEERDALEGHLDESAEGREVFLGVPDDRLERHIRRLLSRVMPRVSDP